MSNKRTREKRRRWMRHSVHKAQSFRFDQPRYGYGWTCVEKENAPSGSIRAFLGNQEVDFASLCDVVIRNATSVGTLVDLVEAQRRCNELEKRMTEHLDAITIKNDRPAHPYFINVNTGECLTPHEDE